MELSYPADKCEYFVYLVNLLISFKFLEQNQYID
jgi:hypothetical protein